MVTKMQIVLKQISDNKFEVIKTKNVEGIYPKQVFNRKQLSHLNDLPIDVIVKEAK